MTQSGSTRAIDVLLRMVVAFALVVSTSLVVTALTLTYSACDTVKISDRLGAQDCHWRLPPCDKCKVKPRRRKNDERY